MRGEIEEVLAFSLVDMALRTESLEGIENGVAACDGMVRRTLVKIARGVAVVMAGRVP